MTLTVSTVTPPASEPVSLPLVKAALELPDSYSGSDALLTLYGVSAREMFEHATGRAIMPTTFCQSMPGWELPHWHHVHDYADRWAYTYPTRPIQLQRGKATSVVNVKYYDANDTLQTLDPSLWSADLSGLIGLVYSPTCSWPALSTRRPRPVQITFVAGWDGTLPSSVVVAISMMTAHLYKNREAGTTDNVHSLVYGWDALVAQYKTGMGVV